ncbi:hypothetical protein H5410_056655 [Solanum commersonii]|uniref:Uncharacterized protein n=1 Tax=Solanum commersonii TaxID=4109 RepID=A0A9J5WKU1_SOLCO|nr:hypothetical protein H5410_056655 [Solanum commersonii]
MLLGYSDFSRFGHLTTLPLRMTSTTPSLGKIRHLAQMQVTQTSPYKTQHHISTTQQFRSIL